MILWVADIFIIIYLCSKITEIVISKPKKPDKKLDARIDNKKTVAFGQKGASDFTKHKDKERKELYVDRHTKNEDWTKSGAKAAGWLSKHVLWNKPTLQASVADINIKSLKVYMLK